jgi:hypothetical protein
VYDEQDQPYSAQTIYHHLTALKQRQEAWSSPAIGHLTADERQKWAPLYIQLATSQFDVFIRSKANMSIRLVPANRAFFETINDSLLVLCLDENFGPSHDKSKYNEHTLAGLNFLHGGGIDANTKNRWFDKTLQVGVKTTRWTCDTCVA